MNPGDRVQVYRPGHEHHGKTGELIAIVTADMARVNIDGTGPLVFFPYDLQPAEEPA